MRHLLQRHPFPVDAFFRHTLVLTYAFPPDVLRPLLPPGLLLDTHGDSGFLAIALVQTEGLRPSFLPAAFGCDFFLSGYRIFTRHSHRRGLCILRTDTNRASMVRAGNLFTRYRYRKCEAEIAEAAGLLTCNIRTPNRDADLEVTARVDESASLPPGSPFTTDREARRFAGPLPFTFSYEPETHSVVTIHGVRKVWQPQPVSVDVRTVSFFDHAPFRGTTPVLAGAFHVRDVPYRWERGFRQEVA